MSVWAGSSPPISSTMTSIAVVGDEVGGRVGQEVGREGLGPRLARRRGQAIAGEHERGAVGRREARAVRSSRAHTTSRPTVPGAEHGDAQRGTAHGVASRRVATSARW